MKILINVPYLKLMGGVANHYSGLSDYWNEEVYYNQVGRRSEKKGTGKYWFPFDIVVYIVKILYIHPDIIILNPSLGKSAIERDIVFLKIAKIFKKKVAVYFHGFNFEAISDINICSLSKNLNKCECIFVLAYTFADTIRLWGVTTPIHIVTTKVDDKLVEDFNENEKSGEINNILFLARIEKEKGVYIALDAFSDIVKKHPYLRLRVAGNGSELEQAKQYVENLKIPNVHFLGNVSGKKLIDVFVNSDLYLFPTYHAEGMPTSVLEAMAFGLPIITRPVGGVCDFFENGVMGTLVESFDSAKFSATIEKYIQNPVVVKETSKYNHNYAKTHFLASNVARHLEQIMKMYI